MNDVLLTVSGVIPPDIREQVAAGRRPRADYLEMARVFGADLLDYARARAACGRLGRLLEAAGGPNLLLAWACFRRCDQYRVIFSDGEQVGIPLAMLMKWFGRGPRRTRHLMVAHVLSVGKKMLFFDRLGVQSHVDTFFVYSTWQKRFVERRWRVPDERAVFTPFMVDSQFFSLERLHGEPQTHGHPKSHRQAGVLANEDRMICAVGLERRDYATLIEAVRGLDVRVVIAAASPWSKQGDGTQGQPLPVNVSVRKFSQYDLRQLYADCAFLVMPLHDVEFQAGVTAILEALAMERTVVCSRTAGQTDVIVDGETGRYVPPGDPQALRQAITALLDDPAEAARMGRNGRRLIDEHMNLDRYVERLRGYVQRSA